MPAMPTTAPAGRRTTAAAETARAAGRRRTTRRPPESRPRRTGVRWTAVPASVNPLRRRHPVRSPVFFQDRPQGLIEGGAAARYRAAEDAFLHRAELPQRAVAAAVEEGHARFQPSHPDGPERERP